MCVGVQVAYRRDTVVQCLQCKNMVVLNRGVYLTCLGVDFLVLNKIKQVAPLPNSCLLVKES